MQSVFRKIYLLIISDLRQHKFGLYELCHCGADAARMKEKAGVLLEAGVSDLFFLEHAALYYW